MFFSLFFSLCANLFGCQEPFTEDRHDLGTFRIAGVAATTDPDGATTLTAAVWSGLGPWHDTLPDLAWEAGEQSATGEAAVLAVDFPGSIGLTAASSEGTETARLDLDHAVTPPVITGFTRAAVDLDITRIADPIADRLVVDPTADTPIAVSGAVRLSLDVPDDVTVHWMATGGQFAELDAHSTDWFAGTAILDDNEVDSTAAIDPGIYTFLALAFDSAGANSWLWMDVAVETDGLLLYTGGRIFPVDADAGAGPWNADVVESSEPAGLALEDLRPATDAQVALCGNPADAPFDFAHVAEGWCARSEVIGTTVWIDGEIR